MEKSAEGDAARAAESASEADKPVAPPPISGLGDAANRFIASMTMNFEMWHDGTGYDLAALRETTPGEREAVETILIRHTPRDWRDIEALAEIDSPKSREAVKEALHSPDPKVRQEAMRHIPEDVDSADREKLLLHTLNTAGLYDGLSQAIDEAAEFHPPVVVEALIRGTLNRDGEAAVHFAALLFYIHGKAAEPFDWNQRPFFLRFNTADRAERQAVFRELCQTIGVDVTKYLRS